MEVHGKKCLLPALLQGFNLYGEVGENYKFVRTKFTETLLCIIYNTTDFNCGLGSSVGIATAYRLDGPGIESRWGRDFPQLSILALRPTQPPAQWVPGLSWG
jgi:hypothetical protein